RLLYNTQQLLSELNGQTDLSEGHRKIAILSALGSSLHMVQDFYSHSDWIHNDFEKMGVPLVQRSGEKCALPRGLKFARNSADLIPGRFKFTRASIRPLPAQPTHTRT